MGMNSVSINCEECIELTEESGSHPFCKMFGLFLYKDKSGAVRKCAKCNAECQRYLNK